MTALLFACNYNDQFDGLEEKSKIKNLVSYAYTMTDEDYNTIATKAKGTVNETAANKAKTDKAFSEQAPAATLIPYLLTSKYYTVDKGSSAMVSYTYKSNAPAYLSNLVPPAAGTYTLTAADYALVWGDGSTTDYFTPSNTPAANLPRILKADFPSAQAGAVQLVSFKVADQEPGVSPTRLEENFSSYEGSPTSAPYRVADGNGWTNIVTAGNHAFWIRTRASGGATLTYVEATANGNGTSTSRDAENEMYFISPAVDLTKTTNNLFSFDIVTGYYVQDGLKILISDNAAATTTPSTVAWDDVTANFTIPVPTPANTYTVMASAGTMNLDTKYAGKKVYIAFKYNGGYAVGAGTLTTTYQIDNILVKGTAPQGGGDVKTRVENAVYTYSGSAWAPYPNAVILNPADYTAMGTSYLTATTAPNYLPAFLASKYPYAQEGNVKAMLYRTASSVTANAADEYTFTGGKWAPTALRTPKTEQYVFADKGWMFDPTVSLVLKRVTGNEPYLFNAITYIKDNMSDKWYPYTGRVNEEHYFGLNSYYAEIVFDGNRVTYGDQAIFDVKDDAAALDALLNERAIDGLKLLCQVNFPTMTPDVAGVEQIVYISIEHYYNANDRRFFKHKFKCVKAGTGMNDLPEFEHLGKEQLPSL